MRLSADREVREELRLLVDDGHAVAVQVRVPRLAVEEDLALVGAGLGGEDLDERRLAGAVGSRDPDDLARARLEVQAVERAGLAIPLAQAADDEAGWGSRRRRGPPRATAGAVIGASWVVRRSRTTAAIITVPATRLLRNVPAEFSARPLAMIASSSAPLERPDRGARVRPPGWRRR